jgi:hypothetical protein
LIPQLVLLTTRLSLRLISSHSSPPCAANRTFTIVTMIPLTNLLVEYCG